MKTVLRNLLSIVRRFKMASLLNVLGLSLAFVAFMMIMMQLDYDWNFDKSQSAAKRIMRFDLIYDGGSQAVIPRPLGRAFIELMPQVEAGCLLNPGSSENVYIINEGDTQKTFKEKSTSATADLVKVFDFDWVEGGQTSFGDPMGIIIPESLSKKIFGTESALDKQLFSANNTENKLIIKGVYRDFPRNSSLSNAIYRLIPPKENYDEWGNSNYLFFVRLIEGVDSDGLVNTFVDNFKGNETWRNSINLEERNINGQLTALPDLHFVRNVSYDFLPKADPQKMLLLLSIAIVILIIAGINYTNFNTALVPMRIKSINTQKVLGSTNATLRRSLICEALCICMFSYLLALVILRLIQYTSLTALIDADMSFALQKPILIATAVMACLLGLISGIYPAFYAVSFPPALVLKGNFGLSPKGKQLRNILIGFQFVASFALVISSLFMFLQNRYMLTEPLGYDKDQMIVVYLNQNINKNRETFTNRLKEYSGIDDVCYAQSVLSSGDLYMGWGRMYKDKPINFQCLPVTSDFLDVLGIDITEGRNFRKEDNLKESGSYIFNQKARAMYDIQLGDNIDGSEIVGFMPDVHFASLRKDVEPMAFYLWGKYQWGSEDHFYSAAYVRVPAGNDLRAAKKYIETILSDMDPSYPFNIVFYDEILQYTYDQELRSSDLITLFGLVAIFISIVGVFGLVVFDSEYRQKEIALRKIMGSTTTQILLMFNRGYVYILLICFAIAAPIAGYGIYQWLQNFAFHIPLYWWVFLAAFLLVGLITVLTVTYQNFRVASANPVKSLKRD